MLDDAIHNRNLHRASMSCAQLLATKEEIQARFAEQVSRLRAFEEERERGNEVDRRHVNQLSELPQNYNPSEQLIVDKLGAGGLDPTIQGPAPKAGEIPIIETGDMKKGESGGVDEPIQALRACVERIGKFNLSEPIGLDPTVAEAVGVDLTTVVAVGLNSKAAVATEMDSKAAVARVGHFETHLATANSVGGGSSPLGNARKSVRDMVDLMEKLAGQTTAGKTVQANTRIRFEDPE